MKHINTYDKFYNFIEIVYFYYDDEVRINIKNNKIIDIYTEKNNDISFINWEKGNNSLYVHCNPKDYHIILDILLNASDAFLYKDEDENEKFYDDIENFLEKQLEFFNEINDYNL